jgi:hypothetical protein
LSLVEISDSGKDRPSSHFLPNHHKGSAAGCCMNEERPSTGTTLKDQKGPTRYAQRADDVMNARYCPRGNCPHPLRGRGRHCASDFGQHHVWCAALPPTSWTTETRIAFFDLYPLTRPFCCMLVFGCPTDSGLVGKPESRLGPVVGAFTDVPRRLRAGPRSTGTNRRLGGLSCDNHRLDYPTELTALSDSSAPKPSHREAPL